MNETELLKSLEYLYLMLESGLHWTAHDIQVESSIDQITWRKLTACQIIERYGSTSKPMYKWVVRQPDIKMARELMQDSPMFDMDDLNRHKETNLSKTINMLHKKDILFNWVTPEFGSKGRRIIEDFRVNYKHNTLYLGHAFLEKYYPAIDRTSIRVAFILTKNDGEKNFLVVNPPNGIPFYKFSSTLKGNSKHPSASLGNKALTILFKDTFCIKGSHLGEGYAKTFTNTPLSVESFELYPFERINGMQLYQIVPLK